MKILDRGYWISQHFYWQSMYYYLLNSARFKSFTFFSACNPAIDLGGMLDDRKTDIYSLLPQHIVPATTIITSRSAAGAFIEKNNLSFPLIVKPNVGLKGFKVYKITDAEELDVFFQDNNVQEREWLLQEYIDFDKEFSVLFYRYPQQQKHGVSSFIEKTYPSVTGDGKNTLSYLIDHYNNPFLNKKNVYKKFASELSTVPQKGDTIILDFIGNYSRGAKFHSKMDFVSKEMCSMLSSLFQNIDGLNFFRIDLKANSVDDLLKSNFKVLEINGVKSEPLHIYDSKSSFLDNINVIKEHWGIIENITREQRELFKELPTFRQGLKSLISIKKLVR
ncbi:MAG: ATP-grasp domain-containing protein [Saprospiraceae bacterium]|nr:ATP-grasp domain-containing protein [Saprospiraceae bacterium]